MLSTRTLFKAIVCCLLMASTFAPAHALSQQELVGKLEAAGYSQVRDIKSSAEGISDQGDEKRQGGFACRR